MLNKRTKIHAMVECSLMIALSTVLSLIKIWDPPFGGSVTLFSMLPLVLAALRWGTSWGLLTGFIHSLLQMLLGASSLPASNVWAFMGVVLLDYVLAFTVLGLADSFNKLTKKPILNVSLGTAFALFLRFIMSFLSGALLWGSYQSYYDWADGMSVWLYSLIYNASYMIPEIILTTVAATLLVKFAPSLFKKQ